MALKSGIRYVVHSPQGTVDVEAEKINLGVRKLWFYDVAGYVTALYSRAADLKGETS